jgi:gamma-glutamyltranspeptidase
MRRSISPIFLLLCGLPAQAAPGRDQSRSMVMTQYGIVATSQAVASQAGTAILERGGSAVDAAIAANAALGVVEPMMNGVGGGIMGGFNQSQAHAQFVSNIVDFHMNVQAALEAARFTKLSFGGCDLSMENGVPAEVIDGLRRQGHEITVLARYSQLMGRGNAIEHSDQTGVNFGGTDPRTDGEAIPEQPPF